MKTALAVEWLKFRRASIAWVSTLLAGLVTPLMAIGLVSLARSNMLDGPSKDKFAMALLGTVGEAHLALETQILAVVMTLAGGLLAAWLFGREFVEGTIGSLFGLPTSRRDIAIAKAAIVATWSVVTSAVATGVTLLASWAISPDTMTPGLLRHGAVVFGAGAITGLLGLPFGWVATVSRGYLAAFATLIGVTAASQMIASIGWGYWVPYVALALWAGAGGPEAAAGVEVVHLVFALVFAAVGAVVAVGAFRRTRIS